MMESWTVETAAENAIAILAEWVPDHDHDVVLDATLSAYRHDRSGGIALDVLNAWIPDRAMAAGVLDAIMAAIERG